MTAPVRLEIEGSRAVVTFDSPGRSVNTFGTVAIQTFASLLDTLESSRHLTGAVLRSAKPGNFLSGADLDELERIESEAQARTWIERGQELVRRLEALPYPTVAAIHGAAVGGGLEVALACTYRVASDDRATQLGLPEVQLGLCPGLGGTWRLPRQTGLDRGLDLLLTGRRLGAREARASGLVDEVVPEPVLLSAAARRLAERPRPRRGGGSRRRLALANPLGRRLVFAAARRELARKTGGGLPAPAEILEAARIGAAHGGRAGEAREAEAFSRLALSDASRGLIAIYRATLAARPKGNGAVADRPRVGVLGSGLMGRGIAVAAARSGHVVRMHDPDAAALGRALAEGARAFAGQRRRGRWSGGEERAAMARLQPAAASCGFASCRLVIEAIVEDLAAKRALLARLAVELPASALLASNTSTLPIARLAEGLPAPERVLGLHFFSPVAKMPLVEIVRHPGTSGEVLERARRFVASLGKTPVVVADGPGFYTTRILAPYLAESAGQVAAGVPIVEVDAAARSVGFPVGPLALVDEVGIDVAARAARTLAEAFPERMPPADPFDRLVAAGRRGRKGGLGFYDYRNRVRRADPGARAALAIEPAPAPTRARVELGERLLLAMAAEAVRCLEAGIVASPTDGDLAAVLGLGFPPGLGGPFRWLDRLGAARACDRLARLREASGSPLFEPPARLRELAARSGRFHG